jgi:very-short-patch-repair endonuclease
VESSRCEENQTSGDAPARNVVVVQTVIETIRRRGGIAATRELYAAGHTRTAIVDASVSGDVWRVRKGWYADPRVGRDVARAWRVGGRLDCVSAAEHYGLWVPERPDILHVAVPVTSSRLRDPLNSRARLSEIPDALTRVHWTGSSLQGDRVAVPVTEAIAQAFRCAGVDHGFVILESALNLRKISPDELVELTTGMSAASRRWARFANGVSESGTESLVKLTLLRRGVSFRQQVPFPGVGRVDFLLGNHLVVEVDSKEHHSNPYADRKRDAVLSILGKRVLRFMYSQVVYELPEVESAILSALARKDHRRA